MRKLLFWLHLDVPSLTAGLPPASLEQYVQSNTLLKAQAIKQIMGPKITRESDI